MTLAQPTFAKPSHRGRPFSSCCTIASLSPSRAMSCAAVSGSGLPPTSTSISGVICRSGVLSAVVARAAGAGAARGAAVESGWGVATSWGAGAGVGAGSADGLCAAGADDDEAKACSGRGTLCTTCADVGGSASGGGGSGLLRHSSSSIRCVVGKLCHELYVKDAYPQLPCIFRYLTCLFVVEKRVQKDEVDILIRLQRVFVRVLRERVLDAIEGLRIWDKLDVEGHYQRLIFAEKKYYPQTS